MLPPRLPELQRFTALLDEKCLSCSVSIKAPSTAPFAAPTTSAEEDLAELIKTVSSAEDDFMGGKKTGSVTVVWSSLITAV